MGYAVAEAARRRGADVVLISGPTALTPPAGVQVVPVRSAAQMKTEVMRHYPSSDIVVKAAAVSDYRPREIAAQKIKKGAGVPKIDLVATEDILETLGREKTHQVLVGFAAETAGLEQSARDKLRRKNLDLVVANDVSEGVFGADCSTVHIFDRSGAAVTFSAQPKTAIADRVLDLALAVREARGQSPVAH